MDVFHLSDDPTIRRFVPHVPPTNPMQPPSVWAIDAVHEPLYWFPRDCPRVTAWPRDDAEQQAFGHSFCTTAHRVHAIEAGWLTAMSAATLYRYRFDASTFRPWPEASGQWISDDIVVPLDVEPFGGLLQRHVEAGIEVRIVPSLWVIHDLARSGPWDFSIVRMRNATPRQE